MSVTTPSLHELKKRSIPPPICEHVSGVDIDVGKFTKLRNLLSPRDTSDIFQLLDNLSNMFYKQTSDTSLFECLHSCLQKDDFEKPVLALLKQCYIYLTHCPEDVNELSHPRDMCTIFQNMFWQATYAAHFAKSFRQIYPSPQAFMLFRFPNKTTTPCEHYAALTMYWRDSYYEEISLQHRTTLDTLFDAISSGIDTISLTQEELKKNIDYRELRNKLVLARQDALIVESLHFDPKSGPSQKKSVDMHASVPPIPANNITIAKKRTRKKKSPIKSAKRSKRSTQVATRRSSRLNKRNDIDSSDMMIATVVAESQLGKLCNGWICSF